MANEVNRVFGWNTKKVAGGYAWSVYEVEHAKPIVVMQSGTRSTRPQAVGAAKRICLLYRRGILTAPVVIRTAA